MTREQKRTEWNDAEEEAATAKIDAQIDATQAPAS